MLNFMNKINKLEIGDVNVDHRSQMDTTITSLIQQIITNQKIQVINIHIKGLGTKKISKIKVIVLFYIDGKAVESLIN